MPTLQTVDDQTLGTEETDLFALMCQRRGWSDRFLQEVEDPEHDELLGLEDMVEALWRAHESQQKITIAPDFDMDGISSGILGYAGLAEMGFDVELHMPDYRRGHDLAPEDIAEIHQKWPSTQVLLTCDGGVNSHRGIAAARALGWTTLVTDHHAELEPGSSADITVDPFRMDETYSHPGICGAHVLYQVLESYSRVHCPEKHWEIRLLRLFAGLGTVSDVMPILYENRQLVRDSLSIARLLRVPAPLTVPNQWGGFDPDPENIDVEDATLMQLLRIDPHHPAFISAFEGFATLLKAFAIDGKVRGIDDLDEGFYGFYLAPAMNSPRRIGTPIEDCFAVFMAAGPAAKLSAGQRVIEGNERRKALTVEHLDELVSGDQPLAPWVYFSAAPAGMYGLLANQMMQQHGHPVVVVNRPTGPDEFVSGSGRAPGWFDIITSLQHHEGLSAIGHQQACGVRIDRASRLDELVVILEAATQVAGLAVDADEHTGDLVLGPDPDCDADIEDLGPLSEFVRRTEALKPFGHAFPEPIVELAIQPLSLRVDRIGSEAQHLRLVTQSGLSCLWWNAVEEHYEDIKRIVALASRTQTGTLRFTAKLQLNTFRDVTRVQAVIVDQLVESI